MNALFIETSGCSSSSLVKPEYSLRRLALDSDFKNVSPYVASELHQKCVMRGCRFTSFSNRGGRRGQGQQSWHSCMPGWHVREKVGIFLKS